AGSQIPRLLDSLDKQWPVGSVLLWRTSLDIPTKTAAVVQGKPSGIRPAILLDGQQRLSTLARVMAPDQVPAGQKPTDVRFHPGRRVCSLMPTLCRRRIRTGSRCQRSWPVALSSVTWLNQWAWTKLQKTRGRTASQASRRESAST